MAQINCDMEAPNSRTSVPSSGHAKTIQDMPAEIVTQIIDNVLYPSSCNQDGRWENEYEYAECHEERAEEAATLEMLSLISKAFRVAAQKKLFYEIKVELFSLKGRHGVYAYRYNERARQLGKPVIRHHVQHASLTFYGELSRHTLWTNFGLDYIAEDWDRIDDSFLGSSLAMFPNLRRARLDGLPPEDWPVTYRNLGQKITNAMAVHV